nr:MAG TPA: hypothetical protein [Caudoviricetes sp.]
MRGRRRRRHLRRRRGLHGHGRRARGLRRVRRRRVEEALPRDGGWRRWRSRVATPCGRPCSGGWPASAARGTSWRWSREHRWILRLPGRQGRRVARCGIRPRRRRERRAVPAPA